jgi:hypothetical protein
MNQPGLRRWIRGQPPMGRTSGDSISAGQAVLELRLLHDRRAIQESVVIESHLLRKCDV